MYILLLGCGFFLKETMQIKREIFLSKAWKQLKNNGIMQGVTNAWLCLCSLGAHFNYILRPWLHFCKVQNSMVRAVWFISISIYAHILNIVCVPHPAICFAFLTCPVVFIKTSFCLNTREYRHRIQV